MSAQVTLKQVAQEAGVSYQTVSKVLNGQVQVASETRERILQAANRLGYRPNQLARSMRVRRSFMLGYSWVQTAPNQVNHILDQFLSSMVREAEAVGYHLLPFPFYEGEAQVDSYRELISTRRVDGFVLSSVDYNDSRIQFLLENKFPFVAFGRSNPEFDFPWVDVDGAAGTQQAVTYLLSKGHRRIAALAWPENSRVGNDRIQGYFQAMQSAGITPCPNCLLRGEGTFETGRKMTHDLLNLSDAQRPTALIALNDTMAIGAMYAAREHGLEVGRDLAIIGFDDAPMVQYLYPPLSSIRQPIAEAGRKCVEMLVTLLENKPLTEKQVLLKPRLILRDSA